MNPHEYFANILNSSPDTLSQIDESLSNLTGRKDIFSDLFSLNKKSLFPNLSIEDQWSELFSKLLKNEADLKSALNLTDFNSQSSKEALIDLALRSIPPSPGFFLKESVAKDLLKQNPPKKVLSFLKLGSIEEAISKYGLFEVFASLRIIEGSDWLNNSFFPLYKNLTPSDFESRPLKVSALSPVWAEASLPFLKKKWHNISHLKELGFIFIMPVSPNTPGEGIRTLSLLLHYFHEVPFYSELIQKFSKDESTFNDNLTSLLRGDVYSGEAPVTPATWLVIQRYLVKDDKNDWRLKFPHISTEALLYYYSQQKISELNQIEPRLKTDFSFWRDKDWVGFSNSKEGNNVSYHLSDVAFSLVKREEGLRYTYHQTESLWNKIFASFFSYEDLSTLAKENLLSGILKLR